MATFQGKHCSLPVFRAQGLTVFGRLEFARIWASGSEVAGLRIELISGLEDWGSGLWIDQGSGLKS